MYGNPMVKDNTIVDREKIKHMCRLIKYWYRKFPPEKGGILKCTWFFKGKM
jgi:hypothetical protein